MSRAVRTSALLLALSGSLAVQALAGGTPVPSKAAPFNYERRIGMVEGDRKDSLWLMISDSTLAVGDSLTLISDEPEPDPASPPSLLTAAIVERLHREPNPKMTAEKGDVFYRMAAPAGALECCIFGYAVRIPRRELRIVAGRAEGDLDHDGVLEHFQGCASLEGLHPTVWSGEPLRGIERWTRYYYLGYNVEPTCTEVTDSLRTGR